MMIIFFKKSASGSYHLLPATDYAIIVVTMYMCTHKALESNRSLLTPFGCQWSRNGVYIEIQF